MSDASPKPAATVTLITYLLGEYRNARDTRPDVGRDPVSLKHFVAWAERYLAETNPPVSTWFPGQGVGLVMADQSRVVVAASSVPAETGQMQNKAGGVPISDGKGFGGLPGGSVSV